MLFKHLVLFFMFFLIMLFKENHLKTKERLGLKQGSATRIPLLLAQENLKNLHKKQKIGKKCRIIKKMIFYFDK